MAEFQLEDDDEGFKTLPDGSVLVEDDEEEEGVATGDFGANLAETLPEETLNKLSSELLELIDRDRDARKRRDQQYADGIRRTGLGDDAPGGASFEGASDVVHPAMAEACVDFAARAIKELFPPNGPVKTAVFDDSKREALERAERKQKYMNWQLTTQMPEYRSDLEQLLTQVPLGGSQYQKFWPDHIAKRPMSEFVPIDDMLLPFAASSFRSATRRTHQQRITKYEFQKRIKNGLYRDIDAIDPGMLPDETDAAQATDKVEGRNADAYNEDGLRLIYEVDVLMEVEGDSMSDDRSAPYIIAIDKTTEKVLCVYRNWKEDDAAMERLDWIVEWPFLPWRGAYGIGLPHLIGGLSAAATGALRALLDSAHINNAATAIKLKGSRQSGTTQQVEITEVREIDAPAGVDDIRKVIMPMPFPPPSPVLFQLLGWLTDAAKGVISTSEEKISDANANMPVGTTLALIEEGSRVFSSIHARLHEAQKQALQIISRINAMVLDENTQVEDLGEVVVSPQDFMGPLDVVPVSDPNIFSETQRFAQNQALLQMAGDPTVPWQKIQIYHRIMKQMHVANPEELLPTPPDPVTADPAAENGAAMEGKPLKAVAEQDHMAHIHTHLGLILDPIFGAIAPPQMLGMMLGHVGQHFGFLYQTLVQQAQQMVLMQSMQTGQPMPQGEALSASAAALAQQQFQQHGAQMLQMFQQAQQIVQKRTPPPPMPPEVQASLEIAKMDNQRRTQLDQATAQFKAAVQQAEDQRKSAEMQMTQQRDVAEFQATQQREQIRMFMEQAQKQFEQQMAETEARGREEARRAELAIKEFIAQSRADNDETRNRIALLMNREDNRQHQQTELLKNRDDNRTAVEMKEMELGQQQAESVLNNLDTHFQRVMDVVDKTVDGAVNDAAKAVTKGD